jgi:hypothetical protein
VDGVHHVEAVMARRLEIEHLLQAVEEGAVGCSSMPMVRSPCTLEAAHRAQAGAGRPICPRIIIRLDSIWMVCTGALLGQAHAPGADHASPLM